MNVSLLLLVLAVLNGNAVGHSRESSESEEIKEPIRNPNACDPKKTSVDVVFILDSSAAVGYNAFAAECASVMAFLHNLNIGQLLGFSRLAFINMGIKATVVSKLSKYHSLGGLQTAIFDLMKMNYTNSRELDIAGSLEAAVDLFNSNPRLITVPKIVVLFSSSSPQCSTSVERASSACRMASKMREQGIVLSTVAVRFEENPSMKALGLGEQRYSFFSNHHLLEHLSELVCTAGFNNDSLRGCACSAENLWLDLIFLFDSSRGVDQGIFQSQVSLVSTLLSQMKVSQSSGRYSRVAFVNVGDEAERLGDLTTYRTSSEARSALHGMKHRNSASLNLDRGLQEASKIFSGSDTRKNARNVIVAFSSKDIDCDNESAVNEHSLCERSSVLLDEGVKIITIGMTFDKRNAPIINIGEKNSAITNSQGLVDQLIHLLCAANCHCPRELSQVRNDQGEQFGECVYLQEIPVGYEAAKTACMMLNMSVADVLGPTKELFLYNMAKTAGCNEYFVGLEKIRGKYYWPVMKKLSDYTNFARGEPMKSKGDCTIVKEAEEGHPRWFSSECSQTQPASFYFCQRNACDTANYCSDS